MEKEKTICLGFYDQETLKNDIKRILNNEDLWDKLEDNRDTLEQIEIIVMNLNKFRRNRIKN